MNRPADPTLPTIDLPTSPWEVTKRVLQAVVSIGLSIALLGWLLPHITHTTWSDIWRTITGIGWPTFFGLFALMMAGLYCYTFTLMGSLPGLTHRGALISNLAGSGVSNVLPAGGAFGTALNYAMFRSWGFSHTQITSSVIVTTVWNVLARAVLPVIAAINLLPFPDRLPGAIWSGAIVGGIAGGAAVVGLVGILASQRSAARIGRLAQTVVRKVRPANNRDLVRAALNMRSLMIGLVSKRWPQLTFGMVGFFGVYFILFACCLIVSGVQVPWRVMFAAYAVGRLLTAVPVTPGGLGVAEAGAATVLMALGADPGSTGAAVTLFALYSHVLEIPCGAIATALWLHSRPKRRAPSCPVATPGDPAITAESPEADPQAGPDAAASATPHEPPPRA